MKKLNSGKGSFAGATLLSKDEMKKIKGGQLTCWCNSGSGGFSPIGNITMGALLEMMIDRCGARLANCYEVQVDS